jgi:hypothetical protein
MEGVKDFVPSLVRVDTTYDYSMADPELTGQLMSMNGKVQRGSPQSLSSVFEDIVKNFPNSYENQRIHYCHSSVALEHETISSQSGFLTT